DNLKVLSQTIFLDQKINQRDEIAVLHSKYEENTLLIVDHYNASESYQEELQRRSMRWLQLDSHAKVNFYATWVMHGSPGATTDLYEPLRRNAETKFLLGPKYCIIKEQLFSHYSERRVRFKLNKVVICFGGGNDRGATLACLRNMRFDLFQDVEFTVAINQSNPDYKAVLSYQTKGVVKIVSPQDLNQAMLNADLAVITPGMMSYEAAFLGLPMLLITIADNQNINSKAWEETKCALNIGSIVDVPENINNCLLSVKQAPKLLGNMSQNCLNLVDGKGIKRIINEITK